MNEKITITLDRADWIELATFVMWKVGELPSGMPVMNLWGALGVKDPSIMAELTGRIDERLAKG